METILTGENAKQLTNQNLSVALFQPEIPGNVGSIARSCVATDTPLIIVGPIPFEITHSKLKRAGLDYWPHLRWTYLEKQELFFEIFGSQRLILTSARGDTYYHQFDYAQGDILIFGCETRGLGPDLINNPKHPSISIPMWGNTRSLNIANSATMLMYEAHRSLGFPLSED